MHDSKTTILLTDFSGITLDPPPDPYATICSDIPTICAMVSSPDSAFVLSVAAWATLQLTWTIVLLAGQLFQIARQMTTLEVSNLGRYGFMGGRAGSSMAMQQGHQHQPAQDGVSPEEDDPNPGGAHAHLHRHGAGGHRHNHKAGGGLGFMLNVLGLDRFTRGKAANGLARSGTATNPFDAGLISNCSDFWTKGKEIGVQYETLYDVPPEGFRSAKRRRELGGGDEGDDDDDGASGVRKTKYIPGFLGRMRGSSASYQPVNSSDAV